jgi:hypothetical protein
VLVDLDDEDSFEMRIGPIRNSISNDEVRMLADNGSILSVLDSALAAIHSTDRARSAVRPGASLTADLGFLSLDTNSWCAAAVGDTYRQ